MKFKEGRHKARAISGAAKVGRHDKGKPQVTVPIKLVESDRNLTVSLFLTQAAAEFSFEKLHTMGWKGTKPADIADLSGLGSTEFEVDIGYETYQGQEQLRVEVVSGGGGTFSPAQVMDPKEFANRLADHLGPNFVMKSEPRSSSGGGGSSSASDDGDGGDGSDGDDIPF